MGIESGLIECPFCKSHLQDTKQEYVDCRYCGKRFRRGSTKEKEEELRRTMVLELADKTQKMKVVISAGKMVGPIFIIFGVLFIFSNVFELFELLLMVIFIANGVAWMAISAVYSSRLEKLQSKMFDISGGRAVFEY